jgi:hypothetical protein
MSHAPRVVAGDGDGLAQTACASHAIRANQAAAQNLSAEEEHSNVSIRARHGNWAADNALLRTFTCSSRTA